jgi:hypothetical protein
MTEEQRHELYTRLEEVIGMGAATTLMGGMPPVGWADVATKRDLEHLEARIGHVEAGLAARIDSLDARLGARIDSLDARLGARIDRLGARIDSLDARIDSLEAGLGARIDSAEAGLGSHIGHVEARLASEFHAALERALREQSNRFLLGTGAMLTLLLAVQELLGRA